MSYNVIEVFAGKRRAGLPGLLAALLTCWCGTAVAEKATSPDGLIAVQIELMDGRPTFQISRNGAVFLEPSPLGLETSIGSFSSDLKDAGVSFKDLGDDYELPHGKVRKVHYAAREMTSRFTNAKGDSMDVICRVSNRDVAFAYRLSSKDRTHVVIQREATGFRIPKDAKAFVSPQARAGGGFAATKPSYEEGYLIDEPVGKKSGSGLGFTFPALFRVGSSGWMLLSETGVSSGYAGTRLSDPTPEGLYSIAFPEPAENGGSGDATVNGALPFLTSWKTLTLGSSLAPIVETTVSTDVVKPLYPASQDYRPGRASWSWLIWQDPSMNLDDQRKFVEMAARMGFEYILVDALWDKNIGREKMASLVKEAASHSVGVLLWYNSNGSWNDAPQTPLHCMDTAPARMREMSWMKSIGVKGIKVDFFGGDKQTTMKLYEDILTDANAFGLMVNFHGTTLPRGWERMYPNHMTSEAVTASENLVFSQGFADREAFNSTVFPFVRNPVAAMDYGPVILSRRFARDGSRGTLRRTTDTFQLATAVLYQSPLQHFGLVPDNLAEQPKFVLDFLKKVPCVWDETRYVDGYPGQFAVIARRSGGRWYVAATHAGKEQRELSFSLPFLKGKALQLLSDTPSGGTELSTVRIGDDGMVRCKLEAGGGAVLFE
ncbi:glycoside hydrolase family 97 catalytic domain-containing protein [Luteolibacter sp. LG18]|uniref:glycoside hydrolase family 97 protein n=1 Tax=Luteolibacter sp. LG18 TaxID=2819286 RepID=UPI002B2B7C66|nr:alpha-glucosidase [Luteolibacter sp. LG18]